MQLWLMHLWWCTRSQYLPSKSVCDDLLDGIKRFFPHVGSQVFLMDLLPPINKVFSLVSQEEKHQTVGGQGTFSFDSSNGLAMVAKTDTRTKANNKKQRKERPFCSRCKIPGHTLERCYKIHGYPPGYKPNHLEFGPFPSRGCSRIEGK